MWETSISHDHAGPRNNPLKGGREGIHHEPVHAGYGNLSLGLGLSTRDKNEFQPGTWQALSLVEILTPQVRFSYPGWTLMMDSYIPIIQVPHTRGWVSCMYNSFKSFWLDILELWRYLGMVWRCAILCMWFWYFHWVNDMFLTFPRKMFPISMKCQNLFSRKYKNISKCCLLKILPRELSIKSLGYNGRE